MKCDKCDGSGEVPDKELEKRFICSYCNIEHKSVEAGGVWHCPNNYCSGPGAGYFRSTLDSYVECNGGGYGKHTVDTEEWKEKAVEAIMKKCDITLVDAIREQATDKSNPFI